MKRTLVNLLTDLAATVLFLPEKQLAGVMNRPDVESTNPSRLGITD